MGMKVPLREDFFFGEGGGGLGGGFGEGLGVGALVKPHTVGERGLKKVIVHDSCLGKNLSKVIFFLLREGGEGREVTSGEEKGLKGPGSPKGDKEDKGGV